MNRIILITLMLSHAVLGIAAGKGGIIVVSSDEFPLSDTGFANSPDASIFVTNVATLFTGGVSGKFHAYSNNFSYTGSALHDTLTAAGHIYSTGTAISFDLPTLLGFDGIFIGGEPGDLIDAAQASILVDYVKAGGNVYVAAGTSYSSPGEVATALNAFLSPFNHSIDSQNASLFIGNVDVSTATHPIFAGVSTLYENGPQGVSGPGVVFVSPIHGRGSYAVVDTAAECGGSLGFDGSTLTLNYSIKTLEAATWNVFLSYFSTSVRLWAAPLPAGLNRNFSIPLPSFPNLGGIAMFSTLSTASGGVICADVQTVTTGSPSRAVTASDIQRLLRAVEQLRWPR